MKAYRSFFVCSLCAHIVLLAYTETLLVSAPARPRLIPVATIFQKAVPLPMGEPAPGPPAGEPQTPPPVPEPVVVPPPPTPTPPKKVRKKPTPRPPREIAKVEPPPAPPLPVDNQPTIEAASAGNEAGDSSGESTSTAATEGGDRTGRSQGRGLGGAGPGGGGGDAGSLAKPDYGVNPKPPYPMVARRMGAEGIVTLRVFVYPDGSVGEVVVSRSSGFSILDDSALNTVRDRWRFVPARLDGRPVESWVEVPIRFILEKG